MKILKQSFWLIFIFCLLFLHSVSLAQGPGQTTTIKPSFTNPLKAKTFEQLAENIISVLIQIGLPVAVFFIIYGGFLLVTARGSQEKIDRGKKVLLWAIVGAAILLGALIIASAVKGTVKQL